MRKAILTVREPKTGAEWKETYIEADGMRTFRAGDDIEKWARKTIAEFNAGLKRGEHPRELVKVDVEDDHNAKRQHIWHKTNVMTQQGQRGLYDALRCENCGITAKRYGLTNIVRDAEFKPKSFETCEGALHLLKRREMRK